MKTIRLIILSFIICHLSFSPARAQVWLDETKPMEQRIEDALHELFERARADENIPALDIQVRAGRINDTLTESLIKPFNPDLVICGVRGLSNLKYAFVGSVSTYLIRHMKCDVLVVKPEALVRRSHAE